METTTRTFASLEFLNIIAYLDSSSENGIALHKYGTWYYGFEDIKGAVCLKCEYIFREPDDTVHVSDANKLDIRPSLLPNILGVACMKDCSSSFSPIKSWIDRRKAIIIPIISSFENRAECPFWAFQERNSES